MHQRVALSWWVIACALLAACNGQGPPDWQRVVPQTPGGGTDTARGAVRHTTSKELIVYLDTSKSIQGYVRADGRTTFGLTLRELRNVGSLYSEPLSVAVRRVDGSVGQRVSDVELSRASMNPLLYSGVETNLAGAFAQFGPGVVAAGSLPSVTTVPLLQVVVTDGVQSTGAAATEANCDAGSDQACVRAQMLRWINAGWSAVLLGIRSEFDGTIYSEINRLSRGRAYAVPYRSNSDRASYRPFYLYAFSPDEAALTTFVSILKRRLKANDSQIVIRELPINVRYTTGRPAARFTAKRDTPQLISVESGASADRLTVRVDARESRPARHPVVLHVTIPWSADALAMGTPEELARSLKWQVVPLLSEKGGGRRPEIVLGRPAVRRDGTVDVPLDPQWPAGTGDLAWNAVAVKATLDFDQDAPQWVRDWSTDLDTSAAYGNRTLFLESAVLGLWRNTKLDTRAVGEIYVRVGP